MRAFRFVGGDGLSCASALALSLGVASSALALPSYAPAGSFGLPAGASAFDVLPDGRVLALAGDGLLVQDALHGSSWSPVGSLPAGSVASFGASFLRVSPGGTRIAVGNNFFGAGAAVLVLDAASLDPMSPTMPQRFEVPHSEAEWLGEGVLYYSGFAGSAGFVGEIDVTGATSRTVIGNIGGASGGVAVHGGRLFTANGFDFAPGGSETGEVRAFSLAEIASLGVGQTIDFEADGLRVARALSGSSLGFDALGNMLIGGGDFFGGSGDFGSFAVADGAAVAAALAGGPAAPESALLRLTPRLPSDSYSPRFNPATGEVLVSFFDNTTFEPGLTVYRYTIPGGWAGFIVLSALPLLRGRRE